jgi:putative phosphoribosyl transferase
MTNQHFPNQIAMFANLGSAGRPLAARLEHIEDRDDLVVLGIVSGGAPVAQEVALRLNAPMDLVIIRRLLMPQGPGSQVCAVNVAGTLVLDAELTPPPAEPETPLEHFLAAAIAELHQRAETCRGGRRPLELSGKTIILVDCGIRTGLTMQAAIKAVRTIEPRRIIAAAPVTSSDGRAAVREIVDEFVCCAQPEPFIHVGVWFKDFSRPADERLGELIRDQKSNA